MQSIFIVEDDTNIREMVEYALNSAGFEARGFTDGAEFFAALKSASPSLVLLDVMLPGEDGVTILKRLRQGSKTYELPVIMLTAKGSELDRVKGLDAGADDYVSKPFSVMEVISRVRAVLRRIGVSAPEGELAVGAVSLNVSRRTVMSHGEEVALTFKEFELLHYLMLNEDIVMSRDRLLDRVWGFDYDGESRTVDMHIKSLRQKLKSGGSIIKTVRNVGYKVENGTVNER